ncbi:Na+/H+ antiporter subunit G [Rhodobacteraceae bacterium WD3A24]|nr:Na+/H+ antiporter subunit G [Rhodobacteraceae bacterium WD3A24]
METAAEIVIALLLVVSGVFGLVGSYGLIKLSDPMMRLHAPTKATTLGVGGVLIASMLYFLVFGGAPSFHELMITLFLFLTAPVSAHFVAKAFLHRNIRREEVVPARHGSVWAGYSPAEDAPATGEADDRVE